MAKAELEVTVIPPEAFILFAGVALHAQLSGPKTGDDLSPKLVVKHSFDIAEEVMREAVKRGYAKK